MLDANYIYDELSPSLPVELERLIFEILSYDGYDPKQLVILMLVARRVHEWIRPILYETFIQSPKARIPDIRRFPAFKIENVAPLVKNLLISEELAPPQIKQFLSHFPNVQNLAVWTNRTDLANLQDCAEFQGLPLRRLSVFVMDLSRVDLSGRVFSRITHLELIRARKEPWEAWEPLASLPCLTHLLLESAVPRDIIHNFMGKCTQLVCLIQLVHAFIVGYWGEEKRLELCRGPDHRLVSLSYKSASDFMRDWENGAQGDVNVWIVAERIAAARQRNYFVDSKPCWLSADLCWEQLLTEAGLSWYSTL
ncbi:hypothetical protein BDN70DRAFT_994267 [Pholiota conissans]|uniref:Uncharacterized protein n=1 Tax=Pholiota conissans TaxID=109636 RepID=A0A9P6D067_9AGAR|nr:hypothetical protein BDN70DRAFT_994267 [Pholiota conissans]